MTSKELETATEVAANRDKARCAALPLKEASRGKATPADVVYRLAAMTAALFLLATVL